MAWPALLGANAQAAPPAELAPLAFLVGEWPATGQGQPGAGAGRSTFAWGVQEQVIVRTSYAEYPAQANKGPSRHDDLMVLYVAGKEGLRADYWDSEGHAIRYRVTVPGANQAEFISEPVSGQPRFRLTYSLAADGLLTGQFAIAPPDQPDAFKAYLTWTSRRAGSK